MGTEGVCVLQTIFSPSQLTIKQVSLENEKMEMDNVYSLVSTKQ